MTIHHMITIDSNITTSYDTDREGLETTGTVQIEIDDRVKTFKSVLAIGVGSIIGSLVEKTCRDYELDIDDVMIASKAYIVSLKK